MLMVMNLQGAWAAGVRAATTGMPRDMLDEHFMMCLGDTPSLPHITPDAQSPLLLDLLFGPNHQWHRQQLLLLPVHTSRPSVDR